MQEYPNILKQTEGLAPQERAAAIAHWVYVKTARAVGRELRVPEQWSELDPAARSFNLESIKTWAVQEGVLEAWTEAVKACRKRS